MAREGCPSMLVPTPDRFRRHSKGDAMHPEILRPHAKIRLSDDLTWAERERRSILARRGPTPGAIRSDPPVQHLSFAWRIRTLLEVLRPVAFMLGGVR
jgi:hypothetical protein